MNKSRGILMLMLVMLLSVAAEAQVYFFSPRYFNESFNHEIGLTFFTDFVRSPMLDTVYQVDASQAYGQPVYMRSYSLFTISYEPQFRLIELGSAQSLSLNVPFALAASVVDLLTPSGIKFSPEEPTLSDLENGRYFNERSIALGLGHAELGALLSYNLGRNATAENTWPMGVNLAVGYNMIYGPLYFNDESFDRGDYNRYMRWGHIVGRLGFQFSRFGFNYMLGLDRTTVKYFEPSGGGNPISASVNTSIYHRLAMTIRLGK